MDVYVYIYVHRCMIFKAQILNNKVPGPLGLGPMFGNFLLDPLLGSRGGGSL